MSYDPSPVIALARGIAAQYRTGFDHYQVVRGASRVADGAGGYTETPAVVEDDYAILVPVALQGAERVEGQREGATNRYELRNMPYTSVIAETDTVTIGARTFEVVGVTRLAALAVVVTAKLEERV